jgi:hypothetical protein
MAVGRHKMVQTLRIPAALTTGEETRYVIWIILAALGIPIWMVLGGLAASLMSRRSFKRRDGVFPAKLRVVSGEVATLKDSWPRRPGYARWVHDVLLVQHGLALLRTEALGVTSANSPRDADDISGLGDAPLVVTLELDGGASVELATSSEFRTVVVGPTGALTDPAS